MTEPSLPQVILVDDEPDVLRAQAQGLSLAGFQVSAFEQASAALNQIDASFDGVVITDLRMPDMDGLEFFRHIRDIDADIPVILMSGHADVSTAVAAVQQGAYDFLSKPFLPDVLCQSARRGVERRKLTVENRLLRGVQDPADRDGPLLGNSPEIVSLRRMIQHVAETNADVLIEGESGTGKSLIAQMLHDQSRRRRRQMVTVDCGALPDMDHAAVLYGVAAGVTPGASMARPGRLEMAHRSTLFLDAVNSAPLAVQHKLRPVLESREVSPVGATLAKPLDLRIIAASTESLSAMVEAGAFLPSLLFLLNGVTLRLPPLRDRRDDIPLLFAHFMAEACRRFDRTAPQLSLHMWKRLNEYTWPGNVRELRQFADQCVLRLDGGLDSLNGPSDRLVTGPATPSLKSRVGDYERALICEALKAAEGDVPTALETLQLPRKTFYDKVTRLGIDLQSYR
jgi:two-component system, NtrC family, C4-dicarboxylate transport response regulator DctD